MTYDQFPPDWGIFYLLQEVRKETISKEERRRSRQVESLTTTTMSYTLLCTGILQVRNSVIHVKPGIERRIYTLEQELGQHKRHQREMPRNFVS